jgi:hypothetical protein
MIIAHPNDGRGLLYHIVDLNGQTVHAYRDFDAALRSLEGDQRIAIWSNEMEYWITDPPAPLNAPTLTREHLQAYGQQQALKRMNEELDRIEAGKHDDWERALMHVDDSANANLGAGVITPDQCAVIRHRADDIYHQLEGK